MRNIRTIWSLPTWGTRWVIGKATRWWWMWIERPDVDRADGELPYGSDTRDGTLYAGRLQPDQLRCHSGRSECADQAVDHAQLDHAAARHAVARIRVCREQQRHSALRANAEGRVALQ